MTYTSQTIITALKQARTGAGLSQRALSARTGLLQSHISRIESGKSDVTLSTLLDLARALDLELMLVPRKLIPAVENITRSKDDAVPSTPPPAYQLDDDDGEEEEDYEEEPF